LLWLFWRWGLLNYLTGLTLNCDSPNLSLPNSYDYRHKPLASRHLALCLVFETSIFICNQGWLYSRSSSLSLPRAGVAGTHHTLPD
jgi:hypothetical protein